MSRNSNMAWEADRAALASAGVRILAQAVVTAVAGASTTYTITSNETRRLICLHLGAGNTDIRVNYNAAATATHMPILPGRYFSVDAGIQKNSAQPPAWVADTVRFWNETVGNISVYVIEAA